MKSVRILSALLMAFIISTGLAVNAHCGHCHNHNHQIACDKKEDSVEKDSEKVADEANKDAKEAAQKAEECDEECDEEVVEETEEIIEEVEEPAYPQSYVEEGFEDAREVLDDLIKSYMDRDLEGILNTISNESDVVFVTAGLQVFVGKDEISNAFEKDFDKIKEIDIHVPWSVTSGDGNTAWITSIILANIQVIDGETSISARQTLVLRKEKDGWKIVNSHFSYPAHRASEKASNEEVIEEEVVEEELIEEVEEEPSTEE